jgi:hypothetical protein
LCRRSACVCAVSFAAGRRETIAGVRERCLGFFWRRTLDGLLGRLEAQADVLVPAQTALAGDLLGRLLEAASGESKEKKGGRELPSAWVLAREHTARHQHTHEHTADTLTRLAPRPASGTPSPSAIPGGKRGKALSSFCRARPPLLCSPSSSSHACPYLLRHGDRL